MSYKTDTFTAEDGVNICYYKWEYTGKGRCRGVIQIAHGIGEYAGRYDAIAQRFQDEGYAVYANDHRAHGKTAQIANLYGYYDGEDYFDDGVKDMHSLSHIMRKEYPNTPFILFGHSMGSLLSRKYSLKYGNQLDALILSGTANFIKGLGYFGLLATKAVSAVRGRERSNERLRALFFDEFNKKFKPNRTKFDWLSRDDQQVDTFEKDPLRIEKFSLGLLADVISNTRQLNKKEAFKKTPDKLPILIFSGDKDPVGEMGKGVKKVVKQYRKNGNQNLEFILYEGGRHEMLNELNKKVVEDDIVSWLNTHIP